MGDTELIGRERLLASLVDGVEAKGCLVTLRGPGGVGKTSLARALHAAKEGFFVELDVCRTVDDITAAIGEALPLPETARNVAGIADALQTERLPLLVLDNAEHVLDACRNVVESLRNECPGARIVVTSRERLSLADETIVDVTPLEDDDAIRLFEIRAREVSPGFSVTEANREDIRGLIDLVDGLPLAIELAASRIRILEPAAIRERLDQRFEILRNKNAPIDRHATLDACVGWSFELLDDSERSVLEQLAIFRGRFGMREAEAVVESDDEWVGDVIESLIEKSLLRVLRDDGVQFLPYEGVRRYVEIHAPFSNDLIVRYAKYYTERMSGPSVKHADLQNVVHAYDLAIEVDVPLAVGLLVEARHRLVRGGFLARVYDMIDRALQTSGLDPASEAWLQTALASCHYAVMDYDALENALDEAEAMARQHDVTPVLARVALMRGVRLSEMDQAAKANERLQEARKYLDEIPQDLRAHILGASGLVALKLDQFEEAIKFLDRGVAAANRTADAGLIARTLSWSALGYFASNAPARGIARLEEALDRFDETHDTVSLAQARITLGQVLSQKDPKRALEIARLGAQAASSSRLRIQAAQAEALVARLEGGPDAVTRLRRALGVFTADSVRNDRWATWLALALQMLVDETPEACLKELSNLLGAVETAGDEREVKHIRRYLGVVHALQSDWGHAREVLADDPEFLDALEEGGEPEQFDDPFRRLVHDFLPLPFELWEQKRRRDGVKEIVTLRNECAELVLPGGGVVELESRYVLRRLFLALLEARRQRPGEAMTLEELIEAGWPDEAMTYESGIRRVYSAIRNLRRLGLEEVVVTAENGYMLSPEMDFVEE